MSAQRILSIQSHVVCGYVGNKASVFPLHLHGFQVDAINSVQLSNHTQYAHVKGQILKAQEVEDLYEGLKGNNVNFYDYVTTGYVGDPSFLETLARTVTDLRTKNPGIKYVCDPVMGDNGHFYVPEELLAVYQKSIVPIADVLLPNQFEAEKLSGMTINCEEDGWKVCDHLHAQGKAETVVITSGEIGGNPHEIVSLGSFNRGETRVKVCIPKIPSSFTGSGDVFAASFLIWSHKYPSDPLKIMTNTVNTTYAVLNRTYESFKHLEKPGSFDKELKLIQSKADLENPPEFVQAVLVKGSS